MKLRLVPIMISVVVTSAVLFGGWFAYHSVAMETPFTQKIEAISGVNKVTTSITGTEAHVTLELEASAFLHEIIEEIREQGKDVLKNRTLQVDVINSSSQEIDHWWSTMLFEIAEAMETRQYSQIPTALAEKSEHLPGLAVHTAMDDDHVYIRLVHSNHHKFIVLPRQPVQLGVWAHE